MFFTRGLRISRRRVILSVGDLVCVVSSILLAALIRLSPSWGWHFLGQHVPSLVGSTLIFLIVFYAGGMYERDAVTHRTHSYPLPLLLVAIGLITNILLFYAQPELRIGRGLLLLAALLIFFSTWALRVFYRVAAGYGFLSRNALVVGEGQPAADVIQLLSRTDDSGFKLFGIVSCTKAQPGEFLEGVPVLGRLDKLREFVDVYAIETIIVATSLAREQSVLRVLRPLRYSGTEILDYVGLYEQLAREIPVEHIDDEWLMHAAMNSSRIHIRKVKRMMDIAVAVVGLVVTLPISAVVAILIKWDTPGPVLFRQRRAGLDGRPYTLMKFRTMAEDAESKSGAVWAGRFDARVTRVGRFLRKWRIDEIPQLVNVLRGEMSLVGPRPERPEFIDTLQSAIAFYKERLMVPPGITGWAQINYPYAASVEAAKRKLQFDLYYIKHMSFFLDVLILLRTFRTIIEGIRYGESSETEPRLEPAQPFRVLTKNAGEATETQSA